MTMPRIVVTETLDGLSADDPNAIRSRRDLRRVHSAMGTRSILLRALRGTMPSLQAVPLRVLELGAGDGTLMLGVARVLASTWPPVELTLLDRQAAVERATIDSFTELGWTVAVDVVDVFEWVASAPSKRWDLIVANLFLHHFEGAELATLINAIAARTDRFFACEPRRAWLALLGSRMVGAIGANAVTRNDAVLSVHAGFCRHELAALWPKHGVRWRLRDYSAGLFSQCLYATRSEVG